MTVISVTRRFSVYPLLDINDPEFARWYGLGMWWAMYGDQQGDGPQPDRYLIDNITRGIGKGRFNDPSSGEFPHLGFYLGMIHGGMIEPRLHRIRPLSCIVILTDPDFTRGYKAGLVTSGEITDTSFMEAIISCARARLPAEALAYELGMLIGMLSLRIIPATMPATAV